MAGAKRGGRWGREEENPPLALPSYPLPLSTPATQVMKSLSIVRPFSSPLGNPLNVIQSPRK